MKIILKILAILLVAAALSGGMVALMNGTSGSAAAGVQINAANGVNGQNLQPPARPDGGREGGDHEGGEGGGFLGIFASLAKVSVIGLLVVLAEKWVSGRKAKPAAMPTAV